MIKMTSFAYFLENKLFFSFIFIVLQQISFNFYSHYWHKKLIFSSSRLKFSIIKIKPTLKPPSLSLLQEKKRVTPLYVFFLTMFFLPNQTKKHKRCKSYYKDKFAV